MTVYNYFLRFPNHPVISYTVPLIHVNPHFPAMDPNYLLGTPIINYKPQLSIRNPNYLLETLITNHYPLPGDVLYAVNGPGRADVQGFTIQPGTGRILASWHPREKVHSLHFGNINP